MTCAGPAPPLMGPDKEVPEEGRKEVKYGGTWREEWKLNFDNRGCFYLYLGRPSNHRERPGVVPG